MLAVVVGCGGPSAPESVGADGGASGPVVPGGSEEAPSDADADRQVVTTASASLAVDDPSDAAQEVSELVESVEGRVDERTVQAGSDEGAGAGADLVVRVPAEALTDVLGELEDLGDVDSVSVSRSDVTGTAVDLDARISALRTSVTRLQALMDGAVTTEALLAAERALSERQEELESLQSQRALLADQVELSTLHVHLHPYGVAPAGGPDGFLDGLATGWRALVSTLGAAVVVLGVVLPWLLVVAIVAAGVLAVVRRVRPRVAADAPTPSVQPEP